MPQEKTIKTNHRLSPDDRWDLLMVHIPNISPVLVLDALDRLTEINKSKKNRAIKYREQEIRHKHEEHHLKELRELPDSQIKLLLQQILNRLEPHEFDAFINCLQAADADLEKHILQEIQEYEGHPERLIRRKRPTEEKILEVLLFHLNDMSQNVDFVKIFSDIPKLFADNMHHVPTEGSSQELVTNILLPFAGLFGAFQIGFATAKNNAFLRNAYTNYLHEIDKLDDATIEKVLNQHPNNPEKQIEHLKLIAKDKICKRVFNDVFYAGATLSIFVAFVLAVAYPVLYVFGGLAVFGGGVSGVFAYLYRNSISDKIDTFIDSSDIENHIIDKIDKSNNGENQDNDEEKIFTGRFAPLNNIPWLVNVASNTMRLGILFYTGFLVVGPFVLGLLAVISAIFTWKPLRDYLSRVKSYPEAALQGGAYQDIERTTLMSFPPEFITRYFDRLGMKGTSVFLKNIFARNDFKTYLLEEKGIDRLEDEIIAAGLEIPDENKFIGFIRKYFFAPLRIWENTRVNNALAALYDASNPKSIALLEQLRHEAAEYAIKRDLQVFIDEHKENLELSESIETIQLKYANSDSDELHRLLRNYMEQNVLKNTDKAIWNVGMITTLSVALLVAGIGLTFFTPIAPITAAAALGIIVLGYIGMKAYQRYQRKAIEKELATVSEEHFIKDLATNELSYVKKLMDKDQILQEKAPEQEILAEKSLVRRIQIYRKNRKARNGNIYESMQTVLEALPDLGLTMNRSNDKTEISEAKAGGRTLLSFTHGSTTSVDINKSMKESWQLLFAIYADCKMFTKPIQISFTKIGTDKQAMFFLQALIIEFSRKDGINNVFQFEFTDKNSKAAIYHVLTNPTLTIGSVKYSKLEMDKLRAHFGLILENGDLLTLHEHKAKKTKEDKADTNHWLLHADYAQNKRCFDNETAEIREYLAKKYQNKGLSLNPSSGTPSPKRKFNS